MAGITPVILAHDPVRSRRTPMPKRSDPPAGPTQRQQRVAELVRHALAEVLARGDIQDDVITRHALTGPGGRVGPDPHPRVAGLGRRARAEVLARGDIQDDGITRHVITVPEVRMSPDLKLAMAYV